MRAARKVLLGGAALAATLALLTVWPWPPLFGNRRGSALRSPSPGAVPGAYTFPADFLFGTATASFQVERADASDWSAWVDGAVKGRRFGSRGPGQPLPGHIRDLGRYPAAVVQAKTNHDVLFAEDLKSAAQIANNAYRFSISWARLFPTEEQAEPDPAALAFYRQLFDEIKRRHLTPSVTLFHFVTPAWLWRERGGKRGWERDDAVAHFERFVRAVVQHFGPEIPHYCTLNEPMVYLFNGYLEGNMPPGERRGDPAKLGPLLVRMLQVHASAYHLIHDDAKRRGLTVAVGLTQHTRAFQPYRSWAPLDRVTAALIEQSFIWDMTDAIQSGALHVKMTGQHQVIPGLLGTQDYLGINYYGRFYVKTDLLHPQAFQILPHDPKEPAEPKNDLGWATYPRGFYEVLLKAHQRYHLPVYVLENGTADAADDDRGRQRFLVEHLRELWLARRDGVDLRGYFHWSLIDNFEWAEGFEGRFGLYRVDYADNYRRNPRPSAALYGRIIREGLTPELRKQYGLD